MLWFKYGPYQDREMELHVGTKIRGIIDLNQVKKVSADGDEAEKALEMVGKKCNNRVVHRSKLVTLRLTQIPESATVSASQLTQEIHRWASSSKPSRAAVVVVLVSTAST
jgi:hypothetical protein